MTQQKKFSTYDLVIVGVMAALVFAATTGLELDRLISRYSRVSPSRALVFQLEISFGENSIAAFGAYCRAKSDTLRNAF